MALPVPGAGSQGLVSFRLFGFPVTIHGSFLLIAFVLGYTGNGVDAALVWVAVVTVSVLAHELGHAFVAAPIGGQPRIDLYAMAGLTRWDAGRAGRGRRIAVSVAGPLAGVAFGVGLLALYHVVRPETHTLAYYAFFAGIFINMVWGLGNLLPMLPLDGGHVLLALMPGDDAAKLKRTSIVSVVVAAATAIGLVAWREPFAAALVMFLGAGNLQRLRRPKAPTSNVARADLALHEDRPEETLALVSHDDSPVGLLLRTAALVRLGQPREAMHAVLSLPRDMRLDPAFEAAVLLADGQEQVARDVVARGLQGSPEWPVRELTLVLVARGEDLDEWLRDVGPAGAAGALDALHMRGRYAEAARWGERAVAATGVPPLVAFNLACSYARTGDSANALRALDRAVTLGLDDPKVLDDPDLASLRGDPAFAGVRARFGSV